MTAQDPSISTPIRSKWDEIVKLFKARSAFRLHKYWMGGLTSRLGYKRVSLLRSTKHAIRLDEILKDLTNRDVKALRTFAAVNQEQATAAFRLTMVTNITWPVGFLAILHQLSPDGLGALIQKYFESDFLFLTVLGTTVIISVIGVALFALANLSQARDIRHLIDLHAAERGIYFGLEDMEELSLT